MPQKEIRPYGTWPSGVTPEWIGELREFSELSWSGDGRLLWVERLSNHSSLMAWEPRNGEIQNLSGQINVGGGLMYGGGSYHACRDRIAFIGKITQALHLISGVDAEPRIIKSSAYPKASPRLSPYGSNLAYIESAGIKDSIKITDYSQKGDPHTLDSRSDFYNYLRWHPFGNHLAWISWNHPYQPWDQAHLNFGELYYGRERTPRLKNLFAFFDQMAGVSLLQPEFSPDAKKLSYLIDQNGWWNFSLYDLFSRETATLTCVEADHALPPWLQNQTYYGFSPDSQRIYCLRYQKGFASLWQLDLSFNTENQIQLNGEYTWLEWLAVHPELDQIALVASGSRKPPEIIITFPWGEQRVIRKSSSAEGDPDIYSRSMPVSLAISSSETVQGLFYPPHNPDYQAEGKPPLLIIVHSGPTRQKYAEFQPRTQYFTSRGYAVLEVNYRGSTGYGREYWEALRGKWGVLDVDDVYQSARALAKQGLIDRNKIALLGSSSGGLTVLLLLVKYPDFFKAAVTLYGLTNLQELVKDPPKFEHYYHDWLVGDPVEDAELYHSRSPLFAADRIRTPVAIFQGGKDPIVPVEQAEQIVSALEKNGVPYEYHLYPEEGHGFKKKENLEDFYLKTEVFLQKYLLEIQQRQNQRTEENP